MKSKFGMALLVLMATGALASRASAQCGTGPMIEFDNNTWAYESNYTAATFHSAPGSGLTIVGKITKFCAPFADLDALDPTKEYTILMLNLVSSGSSHVPFLGTGTRHETLYSGGSFLIYEDLSPDAPTLATLAANPPNVQVPARFADGAIILTGTLANFRTTVTESPAGGPPQYSHSFRADYQFDGPVAGTYYLRVAGSGPGLMQGTWCANGSDNGLCILPTGYSAQPNGKFDNPPTAAQSSTWGTIKQLYR